MDPPPLHLQPPPPPPPHSPPSHFHPSRFHCKHHVLRLPGEQIMVNHRICIFKYHFHVKNMLQKSQVTLTSSFLPIPPFSPPCSTLPTIFLSETETKLYWVQSETKTIFSPFHNLENSI